MSIMKKRQAHSGDRGIMVTALGYAMNARPGPGPQKMMNRSFTGTGVKLSNQKYWSKLCIFVDSWSSVVLAV